MAPNAMNNIVVGRYSFPESHGWMGWIEPDSRDWIAFIDNNGLPKFYLDRDPKTGVVRGEDDQEVGTPQPEPDYR